MSANKNTYVVRGEICEMVGERAALVYERIRYMAEANALEGRNVRDERAWVVNSISDWESYFPWLSYKQIRSALEALRGLGLLDVCQPRAGLGDKTFWYAVTCEAQDVATPSAQKGRPPSAQKGTSRYAQSGRPSAQKGTSYNDKTHRKDNKTQAEIGFNDFWDLWPAKKNEEAARVAWRKLSETSKAEAFAAVQGGWFQSWQASQPGASPIHAATFLKNKRWEDQSAAAPKAATEANREAIRKGMNSPIAAVREHAERMAEKAGIHA